MGDLEVLEQLGFELRRRGSDWERYLPPLRVLYRHVRDGTQPHREDWSVDHALGIARKLGIGPSPLPVRPQYSKCPHCPEVEGQPWHTGRLTHSLGHLPDRSGHQCIRCGFAWVELYSASGQRAANHSSAPAAVTS